MKLLLSGYPGSKKILPASSWLVWQYLGTAFDVYWLNYGAAPQRLHTGAFVALAAAQASVESWAVDIDAYLASLDDELLIFALDDYLLRNEPSWEGLTQMTRWMAADSTIASVRLGCSDFYRLHEIRNLIPVLSGRCFELSNTAEYSVTTQYQLWRRARLREVLSQVKTPWEFEVEGSRYLNSEGYRVLAVDPPILDYPDCSALSARWPNQVNAKGIRDADREALVAAGLLTRKELVSD